jgi:hypothetical protein
VRLAGGADEDGRIARTPRADFGGHGPPRHPLGRFDDFGDREAAAVAEIEAVAGFSRRQLFDSRDVSLGEITHMHVVSDAGAIGSGIIVAKDLDRWLAPHSREQDQRNEVGLGLMQFAASTSSSIRSTTSLV